MRTFQVKGKSRSPEAGQSLSRDMEKPVWPKGQSRGTQGGCESGREVRAIWQRLCLNARVDGGRHARFQTGLCGHLAAPSCCVESRQPEARGKREDKEEASVVAIISGERRWWLDPVRAVVVGRSGCVPNRCEG